METRELGNTGMQVGVVGLGCEGLLDKAPDYYAEALDMMEARGANCIDLYSPSPALRSNLGAALKGRRDRFVLQAHLCTAWVDGQYKCIRDLAKVRASFEDQLARLGTDWLDIGMIHYVDSAATWKRVIDDGILDYARGLKKSGVIRSIGLSSHNPLVALEAVQGGDIEVLMFSINPCYDLQPPGEDVEQLWNREKYASPLVNMDADRARLYEACMERGIGITVMKAFGGGDLLHEERSLAGVALSAHQAIAYALDRPAVACVLAGAHNLKELGECLDYGAPGIPDADYAEALASFPRISWKGHCMYCGHCAPCKEHIDIALVIKLLNLAEAQKAVPETVREHYRALPVNADACSQCGVCETRCPFDVKIREHMARARQVFRQGGATPEAGL